MIDRRTAMTIFGESQPKRARSNQRAANAPCPNRKKVANPALHGEMFLEFSTVESIHRVRNFPETKQAKL
jgi:hypothetical protein